ncbi:unnamed protein product [Cercopithifilaria johnstoni]|uniref:Uncharacterized protein n=1 Tax=Cercopithifilaria johnstoni TaxID=2874296 RepID=A0A8J2Q7G4_9BILA|nr:unnamed protein product [Cercopithifilaria johnstoni]
MNKEENKKKALMRIAPNGSIEPYVYIAGPRFPAKKALLRDLKARASCIENFQEILEGGYVQCSLHYGSGISEQDAEMHPDIPFQNPTKLSVLGLNLRKGKRKICYES